MSPGWQGHTWGPWGLSPQPSRGGGSVGVLPPQGASLWARILFLWGNIGIRVRTSRQGIALFGLTGCHGPAHGLGICRRPARAAPLPQGGRHEGNGALWDMGTCVGTGPCVGNGAVWDMGMCRGTGPCVGYGALCGVRGPLWGMGPCSATHEAARAEVQPYRTRPSPPQIPAFCCPSKAN